MRRWMMRCLFIFVVMCLAQPENVARALGRAYRAFREEIGARP